MAKKIILAVIIIIIISIFAITFLSKNTVDVFMDGENVSVTTHTLANVDSKKLNSEICDYTLEVMNDTSSNITTMNSGIKDICSKYGLENPEINIDSSLGKNQIPVIVNVKGTSMLPTLQDGQTALLNKTKDIHVGDIVVANSPEYGNVIKRVGDIKGDEIYLESDNKNVTHEQINGMMYEIKGITTWVDISNINGKIIEY